MSYYTSYEMSRALRDAGAPQEIGEAPYRLWTTYGGKLDKPMLTHADYKGAIGDPLVIARAFRLDEILEALEKLPDLAWTAGYDRGCYSVSLWASPPDEIGPSFTGSGDSTVEAAAACHLAVLRAARGVAR